MRESGFLDRPPEAYGRAGWALRLAIRNLQWARAQGIGRLVEEHEAHPLRNAWGALRRARWRRSHGVAFGDSVPVFLVGMPRSGTNMITRGLGSSPEFETHNEGARTAFYRYRLRPDAVIRDLVLRSQHRFVLFKPLLDSHRTRTLLDELGTRPGRALWAYRDVDGRARSAMTKFGASALTAVRDIAADPASDRWQAQSLSPESLEFIMSIDWNRATAADGAATLWYARNRLFFDLELSGRSDVLPVSYDTLVTQPATTMKIVCRFLNATWDGAMASHIDARSLGTRPPLTLDPRIRQRCDSLAAALDVATNAARERLTAG